MNKQSKKFVKLIGLDILKGISAIIVAIIAAFIFGTIMYCAFEYTTISFSIFGIVVAIKVLYEWLSSRWKIAAEPT